jgi:predicted proteasome-type protease
VGPPFEVAIYEKDSFKLKCRCSFGETDPYLINVREAWNTGINDVFLNLPKFEPNNEVKQQPLEFPAAQAQQNSFSNDQSY